MNNQIWKYTVPLKPLEEFQLEVVKGAGEIHFELVNGDIWMWFIVDTDEPERETRYFTVEGTGQKMVKDYPANYGYYASHLATFIQAPFVWHLFEHWPDEEDE